MGRKRSSLLSGLINIGATLGGIIGASSVIRRFARRPSEGAPEPRTTREEDARSTAARTSRPHAPALVEYQRPETTGAAAPATQRMEGEPVGSGVVAQVTEHTDQPHVEIEPEEGESFRLASDLPAPDPHPALAPLRSGWRRPEHLELPAPTYWPAVLAFAITLLAWSLVTSTLIAAIGIAVFILALAGWIGDLQHEQH
ncbi:MAG: hypothetical protein AVDCRST_MAG26-4525 [uncultured Chloroflexia bacterium]|uniref:Cytochrome c oxidase polypeptide IV n=1 Tax=uncultured Chloroflexia bacterium TaxID=1672391 RepID=A0A6J4K746_9CHLR|nr:MAG: hypothetical protein AVDCRST_MAG26-4525 [uncultured Chloroflexia bacterium]